MPRVLRWGSSCMPVTITADFQQIGIRFHPTPINTGQLEAMIYEIINQGPLNADELGANGSSIILIKSPAWLTSNGKWVKAYAFADGHSEIKAEPAEGFDAYEQQHMVPPP